MVLPSARINPSIPRGSMRRWRRSRHQPCRPGALRNQTGILNPLPEIAAVARHGRRLIVDAMSSYGVIPVDLREMPVDALIAASGKCLEGVPGMGFVIVQRTALELRRTMPFTGHGFARPVDLYGEDRPMAFHATKPRCRGAASGMTSIRRKAGKGAPGPLQENCATLVSGMRELGFRTFSTLRTGADHYHLPCARQCRLQFHGVLPRVREKGFILYPGKLTGVGYLPRRLYRSHRCDRDAVVLSKPSR